MPLPRKATKNVNIGPLLVRKANENTETLADIYPELCEYKTDNVHITISSHWAKDASEEMKQFVFDLVESNMREMYEKSNWGWNASQKRKELCHSKAQYLIVTDVASGEWKGCVHFRYDMDFDVPVLYCYDLQLMPDIQRKGVGRYMMHILDMLARHYRMKQVTLTVFRHNSQALDFYQKALKYLMDETNMKDADVDYVILSRKTTRPPIIEADGVSTDS